MREITIVISEQTVMRFYAAVLIIGSFLLFSMFAHGATPNPGHPWTEVGNGTWQVSNTQTSTRTFTFPDADATAITTAGAPTSGTVLYGNGTGVVATTTAGTNGFVLSFSNGVPAWVATTTLANISGTLGLANGGTNASLTASNGGIVYSSASAFAVLAGTATAGQILRSGASAAPTWSTATFPAAAGAAGNVLVSDGTNFTSSGVTGTFLGRQIVIGSPYTPTAGTNTIVIQLVGGGGGGGGATAAASAAAAAGGGGSGSYAEKRFTGISGAGSYTVTVGATGAGGIAANGTGTSGGNTTFVCPASCTGGAVTVTANGGVGGVSTASGTTIVSGLGGAGGAVSTLGDLNATGQSGEYAMRLTGLLAVSGAGAPSHFGGGGAARNTAGVGTNGGNYGSGGSGAVSLTTTGFAGGTGASGVIVIDEYR